MTIAKSPVVTMAPATPVHDAIQIMAGEGFRRVPIVDSGTKRLQGIITATDIINYLGGGNKFQIVQRKYAGSFFKAIHEPVKGISTRKAVSISTSAKISDAIELMRKHKVGGLPVVDEDERVWAIITERDIIFLFSGSISGAEVADLMSKNVVTAKPEISVLETEKTMINNGFRRLPLVSDQKLVGIVTVMDVLRFFASSHVFKHLQSGTINQVLQTPVLEIATKDVSTIEPEADVGEAARLMLEKRMGSLPVIKNEKLVGIITERDFFKLIT
jgi:CBS domain-containing protein